MSDDTLQEVTQVAVIRHLGRGVLLLHTPARRWHFPDATLNVREPWDRSLARQVEADTGITDLSIRSVLRIQNFAPGVVHERARYDVFFLCGMRGQVVRLGGADRSRWVARRDDLAGLEPFHPLVEELVLQALAYPARWPVSRRASGDQERRCVRG